MMRHPPRSRRTVHVTRQTLLKLATRKATSVRSTLLKKVEAQKAQRIIQQGHQMEIQLLRLTEEQRITGTQAKNVKAFIHNYMIKKMKTPSWNSLRNVFPFLSQHTQDHFEFKD